MMQCTGLGFERETQAPKSRQDQEHELKGCCANHQERVTIESGISCWMAVQYIAIGSCGGK